MLPNPLRELTYSIAPDCIISQDISVPYYFIMVVSQILRFHKTIHENHYSAPVIHRRFSFRSVLSEKPPCIGSILQGTVKLKKLTNLLNRPNLTLRQKKCKKFLGLRSITDPIG